MSSAAMRRSRLSTHRRLRGKPSSEMEPPGDAEEAAKPSSPPPSEDGGGAERQVKALKLSKALTIAEGTTVSEACRRMAHRRVDACLLTDSSGLLSGIVTDQDIAVRVVAEGLRPDQTIMSKIMTRSPVYVTSDSMAIDALQKMVLGKFRHLPIVENGEVIGMLDITKCLYDAILRMEKAAEQGSAVTTSVEGVENQLGSKSSAHYAFLDALRNRMLKPCLSTIIMENTKLAIASPSDPVYLATKKMRDHGVNSVVIVSVGKPQGILTSKDVLMRVVAHNISPELTLVEKVMTASPACATIDTTILDALHMMHNGKFLHLPVMDKDGRLIACLDVLQITHAATYMGGGSGNANDVTSIIMQKFWDSALSLEPIEEESETNSEISAFMASETGETMKSMYPPLSLGNYFYFKFEDQDGRMHRFSCLAESLSELLSAVSERFGPGLDADNTQILYEDEEGDKILVLNDNDLLGAVQHARLTGLKVLRLHLERRNKTSGTARSLEMQMTIGQKGLSPFHVGILAGAVILTSVAILVYSKRSAL